MLGVHDKGMLPSGAAQRLKHVPTRATAAFSSAMTSTCSAGIMTSATVSSSRRMPRPVATRMARSPRRSVAVITPRTFSRSSTTRSSRTPRVIMNSFAPASGACGRIVAGVVRRRSVITSSAGDSSETLPAWA
jgi:hypothetical protein